MTDDIKQEIEKIVDEYQISHKGSAQCKCISGARGHLIAKLMTLADRIREDERERIYNKLQEKLKTIPHGQAVGAFGDYVSYANVKDLINSLTTK